MNRLAIAALLAGVVATIAQPAWAGCDAACRRAQSETAKAIREQTRAMQRIERERQNEAWRRDVFRRYQERISGR